jgi:hypothetical protein
MTTTHPGAPQTQRMALTTSLRPTLASLSSNCTSSGEIKSQDDLCSSPRVRFLWIKIREIWSPIYRGFGLIARRIWSWSCFDPSLWLRYASVRINRKGMNSMHDTSLDLALAPWWQWRPAGPAWPAGLHEPTRPRRIATQATRRGKERSQAGPGGVSAHGHIPGLKPFLFSKLFFQFANYFEFNSNLNFKWLLLAK